jgi:hypothetical protein
MNAEARNLHRNGNFLLIRFSARWKAGNGLVSEGSDSEGGGGSSFSAGTGEYVDGDESPRPKEFP